jgi:hypothetical protein
LKHELKESQMTDRRSSANLHLLFLFVLCELLFSGASPALRAQTAQQAPASVPSDATAPPSNKWRLGFLPYLWFPGMHGTTAVRGFTTSVHASAGDLLSHFRIGLMGTMQASKNRFLLPTDLMWIKLGDDRGLPDGLPGIDSVEFKASQFVLTPQAGYRIVDKPNFKVDGLGGLRYWHLGQELAFSPAIRDGASASADWVDAIGGGRIQVPLSSRTSIVIKGQGGAGGASPEYEIAGLLGFQVKKSFVMQAGWRYIDVHYRNSGDGFLYDVASSGVAVGATLYLK